MQESELTVGYRAVAVLAYYLPGEHNVLLRGEGRGRGLPGQHRFPHEAPPTLRQQQVIEGLGRGSRLFPEVIAGVFDIARQVRRQQQIRGDSFGVGVEGSETGVAHGQREVGSHGLALGIGYAHS